MSLYEFKRTIESLWPAVHRMLYPLVSLPQHADKPILTPSPTLPSCADFIDEHPEYIVPDHAMNFLSDNGGTDYNLCHCKSIATNRNQSCGQC